LTFFVDASILIYSAVPSEHRAACLEVLDAIAGGNAEGRTSPSVLEEVWQIERSRRAGDLDGLAERAYILMSPLLPVGDEAFRLALSVDAPGIGTNDRLHVGTCMANGIDDLFSADRDFDEVGTLRRIDPSDERGVRSLLDSSEL